MAKKHAATKNRLPGAMLRNNRRLAFNLHPRVGKDEKKRLAIFTDLLLSAQPRRPWQVARPLAPAFRACRAAARALETLLSPVSENQSTLGYAGRFWAGAV